MSSFLSFDPSSTAIGFAVMPLEDTRPPFGKGVITRPASWDSQVRILSMIPEIQRVIDGARPMIDRILIETPGKGQSRTTVRDTGISTPVEYSMAVGAVYALAAATGLPVVAIRSDRWAKEMGEKSKRVAYLKYLGFDHGEGDPGHDRCDAICMGLWYRLRYANEPLDDLTLLIGDKRKVSKGKIVPPLTMGGLELVNGFIRPRGARWKPNVDNSTFVDK